MSSGAYEIHDQFRGGEYGVLTDAALDAILFIGRQEGILIDPVYSGKVFSGLLAHQAAGRWRCDQNVLFLHTGGVPSLFAYHEGISNYLREQGIQLPE